jgi:acetyltransferase-like isoleucine patch superfamily enzyme
MKHPILKMLSIVHLYVRKVYDRGLMYLYRYQFAECGENVVFYPTQSDLYYKHIFVGNDVFIGAGASFMALVSFIKIGDHVQIAPNVTIRGGNHSFHIVGKFLSEYKTSDKRPEDDQPVIIEDDVWIGTGVIILKGVTIRRGAIVSAGAIVLKNVPPYSIVAGVPAKVIKYRWAPEIILQHEKILYKPENRLPEEAIMNCKL